MRKIYDAFKIELLDKLYFQIDMLGTVDDVGFYKDMPFQNFMKDIDLGWTIVHKITLEVVPLDQLFVEQLLDYSEKLEEFLNN